MTDGWTVRVRGEGRVGVPAHGLADAEHRVEKELGRLFPEARVEVTEVARPAGAPRIVEELAVSYRVDASVEVEADSPDEARRAAFRLARSRLESSRYRMTAWSAPQLSANRPQP